jgi:hypothetical protein
VPRMARLMCWLLGHKWEEVNRGTYGPSLDGYVWTQIVERCKRCHKERSRGHGYKV